MTDSDSKLIISYLDDSETQIQQKQGEAKIQKLYINNNNTYGAKRIVKKLKLPNYSQDHNKTADKFRKTVNHIFIHSNVNRGHNLAGLQSHRSYKQQSNSNKIQKSFFDFNQLQNNDMSQENERNRETKLDKKYYHTPQYKNYQFEQYALMDMRTDREKKYDFHMSLTKKAKVKNISIKSQSIQQENLQKNNNALQIGHPISKKQQIQCGRCKERQNENQIFQRMFESTTRAKTETTEDETLFCNKNYYDSSIHLQITKKVSYSKIPQKWDSLRVSKDYVIRNDNEQKYCNIQLKKDLIVSNNEAIHQAINKEKRFHSNNAASSSLKSSMQTISSKQFFKLYVQSLKTVKKTQLPTLRSKSQLSIPFAIFKEHFAALLHQNEPCVMDRILLSFNILQYENSRVTLRSFINFKSLCDQAASLHDQLTFLCRFINPLNPNANMNLSDLTNIFGMLFRKIDATDSLVKCFIQNLQMLQTNKELTSNDIQLQQQQQQYIAVQDIKQWFLSNKLNLQDLIDLIIMPLK